MKKSLLALAVLGAFAGAASAQSSVTLFGVVDLNLRYVDNGGGKQYQMGQDGNASSRLGFRGVEDLGGGLNASFWIEGAINSQNGTSTGQTWQRRSTVSLSGGWGEVRLGRDYTATFWNGTIFDPFGTNGVGSAGNIVFVSPFAVPSGAAYGTLVRANNMVGYFLPSGIAGGLYGQFQVAAGQGANGNKYYGGRLGYAAGPFNVAGAWGRTQVTGGTPNDPTGNLGDSSGTNWNLGGSWDFSIVKVSAYYGNLTYQALDQSNWYIGLQAPVGLWTFKGSWGEVSRTGIEGFAPGWDDQRATQIALGATYDLSKRTALYGTYSHIDNSSNARFVVAPLTGNTQIAGGAQPNENSQGFEIGIRHSF